METEYTFEQLPGIVRVACEQGTAEERAAAAGFCALFLLTHCVHLDCLARWETEGSTGVDIDSKLAEIYPRFCEAHSLLNACLDSKAAGALGKLHEHPIEFGGRAAGSYVEAANVLARGFTSAVRFSLGNFEGSDTPPLNDLQAAWGEVARRRAKKSSEDLHELLAAGIANEICHLEGERSEQTEPRANGGAKYEFYVTLDQAANIINRTKDTLRKKVGTELPEPDIRADKGSGEAHQWKWDNLRPALEKYAKRPLPEIFPTDLIALRGVGKAR